MAADLETRAVASLQQWGFQPGIDGGLKVALDDAIEVEVARLSAGPDHVPASATVLSDSERQRASRFAFERDRRRFILGRARLRRLLGSRLGVRPDVVELECGAHGKPALAGRFAD